MKRIYQAFLVFLTLASGLCFVPTAHAATTKKAPAKPGAEQIIVVPPLRKGVIPRGLTVDGIIRFTNLDRLANNKSAPTLVENQALIAAAKARVADMFAKQYFAHNSPSGVTPSDVIKKTGYNYIIVGENIALGNFYDDEGLVDAWMNSPHHRENILKTNYTEIGVAIATGTYHGLKTWIAAQEFGRPLSTCPPAPAPSQKNQIDLNNAQIVTIADQIADERAYLITNPPQKAIDVAPYNDRVVSFNALVEKLNALSEVTQSLVTVFNQSVTNFNACVTASN